MICIMLGHIKAYAIKLSNNNINVAPNQKWHKISIKKYPLPAYLINTHKP